MNRELTGREKVMLLILIVLVMALGYYKLIFEPINDQVAAYRDSAEQEQTELTTELVRAEQLKKMESAVAELRQRGDVKPIPAYDNSKALMVELHRILASAQEYSLDFSAGTTEEDYIVLRPISLSYTTATYTQSRAILDALSGSDYTLPEARPDGVTATGVFAAPADRASGYTAALLAADGSCTADALTGPLNGVYSAVTLEWDHMADSAENAVFRRAKLTDLLADCGSEGCSGLVLIPFKCNFEDSDLTTEEYNLDGLLDYPVLADAGCLALNADTDAAGLKAAKSAALWLYSNGAGEDALTETLGVVTPWNTAADSTAVLAMQIEQVGTGILPGAVLDTATAEALTANELSLQGSEKHTKAERTAFVDGALAALGAE